LKFGERHFKSNGGPIWTGGLGGMEVAGSRKLQTLLPFSLLGEVFCYDIIDVIFTFSLYLFFYTHGLVL
jgi:hypothetical protein